MEFWPTDPKPRIDPRPRRSSGARVSSLAIGTHTGTHVDAPLHFVNGGTGIDAYPLSLARFRAFLQVVESEAVDRAAVDLCPDAKGFLFKRAKASRKGERGVGLDEAAAEALVARGVQWVGVDALSIAAPDADGAKVHRILFRGGVWIVENLDVSGLAQGWHEVLCLPLRIRGADGSPCRVVARPLAEDER